MKKLVLVVAMFMFVCGGATFAMAQDPVKTQPATEQTKGTEDSTTSEPAKDEPKAEEPTDADDDLDIEILDLDDLNL